MIRGALHTDPQNITSITISPCPHASAPAFSARIVTIKERPKIDQIGVLIGGALGATPNHPVLVWSECLVIATRDGIYRLMVTETSDASNGTLIYLWSGQDGGVLFGVYRSDALGALLKSLLR